MDLGTDFAFIDAIFPAVRILCYLAIGPLCLSMDVFGTGTAGAETARRLPTTEVFGLRNWKAMLQEIRFMLKR